MGIRSQHEAEKSTSARVETRVEIGIGNVVGDMNRGEAVESSSGVCDDGRDSDKRGAGSIGVGR